MPTFQTPFEVELEADLDALLTEERAPAEPVARPPLPDYESEPENDSATETRALPALNLDAEVSTLITEERAKLTNRCNWFQKALEERTDQLNETERVVVQLHHDNKALRAKLDDLWEWNSSYEKDIEAQEESLRRTTTALWRAEERVETHEASLLYENDSAAQRQLQQALEQVRNQVRELRVELDDKKQEINFLSEALHDATVATQVARQTSALQEHMQERWKHTIAELLPMLTAENELLKEMTTQAWELGSTAEATYYDYKQLLSQPVYGSSQTSALAIRYAHDAMSVGVRRNVSPRLDVYIREPQMDYSICTNPPDLRYLTRRDSTPTIMTIDTEAEQSYLEEMDVGIDTRADEEMVNAGSDTAITGPLIRRPSPSKAWTAFRESPTHDLDSDDEDREPLLKRQRGPIPGYKQDDGLTDSGKCWCAQFSMLDETLVRHMASLTIIDNAVAVIDKASSPAAPALPQTSKSIGVQTDEMQVPHDVHVAAKEDPRPPGSRASKSFALFTNGPVYLPNWHRWAWRSSKPDPPPVQEKKRPTILDLPPYPKVDSPLPERISPIREALSTRVDGRPLPRQSPDASASQPGTANQVPGNPVSGPFGPPGRVPPNRTRTGTDCWVILTIVVFIYLWFSGGQGLPPDAGWIDANEVPREVLYQLRDDPFSDFRFPEVVDYEMVHWSLADRVAHG